MGTNKWDLEKTDKNGILTKHKVAKDHTKYTHKIEHVYSHTRVNAFKKGWREHLEVLAKWFEDSEARLQDAVSRSDAMLEANNEEVIKEIAEFEKADKDKVLETLWEQKIKYIVKQKEFIKQLDVRKAASVEAIKKELEMHKQKNRIDADEKIEALKLWANK